MRNVVLVDVENPYRDALVRAANLAELRVVEVTGDITSIADSAKIALVVIAVSVGDNTAERVNAIRNVISGPPRVVLMSSPPAEVVKVLGGMGTGEVIELPDLPDRVAERCLQHRDMDDAREIPELIGTSDAVRQLRRALLSCAESRTQILLTGETGTGKSLVARVIHRLSKRRNRSLVHVDCSSLSPNLVESELFGHERGAFTGANEPRAGFFERAGEGTIFLDEIGELDRIQQVKFLRVLEDREFERVGGSHSIQMLARVVSATNRNLNEEVEDGRFRRDLFYRLRVIHLQIPTLLQRLSDMALLVDSSVARLATELGRSAPEISPDFIDRLIDHSWPGNVRELVNVLEAVLVRKKTCYLRAQDLDDVLVPLDIVPGRVAEKPNWSAAKRSDPIQERHIMSRLLIETGGNVARVARRMGINRSTVRYKIRRYDLVNLIPRD